MKKILLFFGVIISYYTSMAQCSVRHIPLGNRAANANLIIEGKITDKFSYWNDAHNMIYTTNVVEVYKVFKGTLTTTSIEVLTIGGIVGLDKITVEPSLSLNVGETGVFTCEAVTRFNVPLTKRSALPRFEVYSSIQGFIKYDLMSQTASDPFNTYHDIEAELYNVVLSPGLNNWVTVAPFNIHTAGVAAQKSGQPLQTQSITGFAPTTVNAGTGTQITITGTGFGATQGSGSVRFKNADDGGATFITPLASQYISWSATQIVVEVPSSAGTGVIEVVQGATQTSAQTLTVNFAQQNVEFDPGPGTIAYQTDHVDDNGSGGYTWRMNTGFDGDAAARASFMRAFDTWRCNTGVNWTIGATTSINDAVSDGSNVICFDNTAPLSPGILGVCYSYWSGCASGPNIVWYVNELDIIFDEGSNITPLTWEYGTGAPSGSEYDFETVAVHELGHGHQLGHVISPGAIMHYAISNGTSNRSLGVNDLAGGNYVQAKSIVANICGPGAMTNHSCGVAPVASFSASPTTLCEGATVSYTDLSTNTPTSWAWTFAGGTPSSSTAQNPTITYNTSGTYAVTLTATNASGSDVETISGYITVNAAPATPGAISGPATICTGVTDNYSVTSVGGVTYNWTLPGDWSGTSSTNNISATTGTTTGNVSVTATNGCGTSAASSLLVTVNDAPATPGAISGLTTVCEASVNSYSVTMVNGVTYNWSLPGDWSGTSSTNNIFATAGAASGNVSVTATNGCGTSAAASLPVTANAIPAISVNSGSITIGGSFTMTPTGAATYTFSSGGAVVSPTITSTYTVTGTSAQGCVNVTGDVSTVTVNGSPVPLTELTPAWCNTTLTTLDANTLPRCNAVTNATDYEWQFTDVSSGLVVFTKKRGAQWTDFYLTGYWPNVQYNKTYSIKVRAKVGGIWGSYGNACTLTTPTTVVVPTQLTTAYCNTTLATFNSATKIACDQVLGATDYQYQFTDVLTNSVYTKNRAAQWTDFYVKTVTQLKANKTYSVVVRAYVNGAWGTFGQACTITIPAAGARSEFFDEEEMPEIENTATVNAYPNPASDVLNIDFDVLPDNASVEIYNSVGELVLIQQLTDMTNVVNTASLTNGLYFTKIIGNNKLISAQKIIKQ